MLLPKARQDKLTVRELPDETLIYDHAAAKAHCLNQTAGLVWKHCDGQMTVAELAVMLQRELSAPAGEALVHLALEQLSRRRLLEPLPAETADVRQSRRRVLRKLGVALAALPAIMTLTAPTAAQAASPIAQCPSGLTACLTGCKNLLIDVSNCGFCSRACTTGTTPACCSGNCTDLNTDPNNCGSCGHPCGQGFRCSSGACVET
jgi:hypothetical protein